MSCKQKKLSFREVIEWIALNDEPRDEDRESVRGYISVQLAADMLGRPAYDIANRVVHYMETGRHYASNAVVRFPGDED